MLIIDCEFIYMSDLQKHREGMGLVNSNNLLQLLLIYYTIVTQINWNDEIYDPCQVVIPSV